MSTECFHDGQRLVYFQSKVFKRGFVVVSAGGLPIIVFVNFNDLIILT